MKHLPIAAFAAALCLASPLSAQETTQNPHQASAGTYEADPGHTRVTWKIKHLGFSTYSGIVPAITGTLVLDPKTPNASRVEVTIPVNKIGTLDPALDAHLMAGDFFDVANFPSATFKSTRIEADGDDARITGELTLRGVTRTVTLEAEFNQAGVAPTDKTYTVGFDAKAKIKRSDFGMTAFLPMVGDEVELAIEAEFKKK
ncbi:YceI family protein [Aquabacter sp. P-9]|uniref:YceI family protein n=1 Tax=Aquabacter sediminis TaxID=3029197 RepID=UPI00237DB0A5|nr:YceI family protein [Aquabacter sp. P-9]MDE1569754.1 YceI family protein [Aquabacter sp. P-9]